VISPQVILLANSIKMPEKKVEKKVKKRKFRVRPKKEFKESARNPKKKETKATGKQKRYAKVQNSSDNSMPSKRHGTTGGKSRGVQAPMGNRDMLASEHNGGDYPSQRGSHRRDHPIQEMGKYDHHYTFFGAPLHSHGAVRSGEYEKYPSSIALARD